MRSAAQRFSLLLLAPVLGANPGSAEQNWTHYVRIGAYGLEGGKPTKIVRSAQESGVFGIEVDNDIEGRYESFLNPRRKAEGDPRRGGEGPCRRAISAFVYIAGTECITANADKTAHTLAKDHPDWLQRKITGSLPSSAVGRLLDCEGRRRRLGQSLCPRVAQDLHGASAADCGHRH